MTYAPAFVSKAPDQGADMPSWAQYPGDNIPPAYALPTNGDEPLIHVYVVNHLERTLHFQFRDKLYNRIPPKYVARQPTYEGELWNIVDLTGKVYKTFEVTQGNQREDILSGEYAAKDAAPPRVVATTAATTAAVTLAATTAGGHGVAGVPLDNAAGTTTAGTPAAGTTAAGTTAAGTTGTGHGVADVVRDNVSA
jgi:hypothetical protein